MAGAGRERGASGARAGRGDAAMAGILFEDIFDVKDIDPEGKKFDRGEWGPAPPARPRLLPAGPPPGPPPPQAGAAPRCPPAGPGALPQPGLPPPPAPVSPPSFRPAVTPRPRRALPCPAAPCFPSPGGVPAAPAALRFSPHRVPLPACARLSLLPGFGNHPRALHAPRVPVRGADENGLAPGPTQPLGVFSVLLTPPLSPVSRLHCESESFKMDLILDVNIQIYPVDLGKLSGC